MNKSAIVGIVVGVAAAAAIGGIAGNQALNADEAEPPVASLNCREVKVHQSPPADEKRIAGTVIGAVVGGAVGNDVGDSDLTAAAGAAAGAYAGNQAQKKFQENRAETTTEVRCD